MPKGIYIGKVDGYSEYYTSTSPLPRTSPNADIYESGSNMPATKESNNKEENNTTTDSLDSNVIEIYEDKPIENSNDSSDVEVLF